jgi:hypothetical protein
MGRFAGTASIIERVPRKKKALCNLLSTQSREYIEAGRHETGNEVTRQSKARRFVPKINPYGSNIKGGVIERITVISVT